MISFKRLVRVLRVPFLADLVPTVTPHPYREIPAALLKRQSRLEDLGCDVSVSVEVDSEISNIVCVQADQYVRT